MKVVLKKKGDKGYYYVKKSIRIGDTVKTFSRYIGPSTLPKNMLEKDIEYNKSELEEEIKRYMALHSPLKNLLTLSQVRLLRDIKQGYQRKMSRLSDLQKKKLYEPFGIRFTYNTNAIEGSTVTERETLLILKDKVAPGGKTLIEIREAENHEMAFEYVLEEKGAKITKEFILRIHRIVSNKLLGIDEGKFRDIEVSIMGADVKTAKPENIDSEMNGLLRWYGKTRKRIHPVEAAAVFHEKFEKIHPFRDYNGRVGRLLLNLMLQSEGYPLVIIPVTKKEEYYSVLEAGHTGRYKPIVQFVYRLLIQEAGRW